MRYPPEDEQFYWMHLLYW